MKSPARLATILVVAFSAAHAIACSSPTAEEESGVSEDALVGLANSDVAATMSYGQTVDVSSVAGRRYRAIRFQGTAGDKVVIAVDSANDPRAWLLAPDFRTNLAANDDGDSTKNARMTFTLTSSGMHVVAFRDKNASPITFRVSLSRGAAAANACSVHPWSMQNGCADRQGRSSVLGPRHPRLAWHVSLPARECGVRQLVVDAAGTAYAAQSGCRNGSGAALTAVRPDGTFAWTRATGTISALALGADGNVYAYMELRGTPRVQHQLIKYTAVDGTPNVLFSEDDPSGARRDSVNPLPDGRIHFTGPLSRKVYDPNDGSVRDAPPFVLPRERAALAGDGNTWNTGPGGTVFGVTRASSGYGQAVIVRGDGSLLPLTPTEQRVRTDGMNVAYGTDDSVALAYRVDWGNAGWFVAKFASNGTRVYSSPWRLEAGEPSNMAIDAEGIVYAGGSGFAADGAFLWSTWTNGTWHPTGNLVALAPNRTLLVAHDLIGADTLSALRD